MDTRIYYSTMTQLINYQLKGSKIESPAFQQSSDGNQNLFVKCDTDFNLQLVGKCEVVTNFILRISEWSMVVRTAAAGRLPTLIGSMQFSFIWQIGSHNWSHFI